MVEPLLSTTSTRAEVWLVLCEMCLSYPSVDVFSMTLTCAGSVYGLTTSNCRVDGRSVTCTTFCICLLQWMYTLMVEPLFSTTSTRAEVWVVLCELCLSHPSVDVCALFLLEVDGNPCGLTTSMCRVDGRSLT
jgi:hypothetical protein